MRNPSSSSHNDLTSSSKHKSKTTPCCSKVGIKKGPWTREEDAILADYIKRNGEGQWRTLPQQAGLLRCGKSCRLRWMNYLRPSIKRGPIAPDEEDLILRLHRLLGNRWSLIAGRIPGRTDNEIKNFWNTHLSKKLINKGIDPRTHKPFDNIIANPNPNSNSNHCPSCSELPHDNPNPNPNYSCLEERNESRKCDQCNSQTPPAEEDTDVHHGNYRANEGLMEIKPDDHHDQNQGNNKELEPVNSNGCDHEDAAFSSFLDSLINDEIELINQVQVLQSDVIVDDHEPAVLPFSSSSSRSMNSSEHIHDAFWEDEFAYAMETISGAEENMALVFDNQQNT